MKLHNPTDTNTHQYFKLACDMYSKNFRFIQDPINKRTVTESLYADLACMAHNFEG